MHLGIHESPQKDKREKNENDGGSRGVLKARDGGA
jgi:hypothetical protein